MERTLNAQQPIDLHDRDPLLKFLAKKLRLPWPAILGLAVAVVAISYFGVGAVVSYVIHKEAGIIRAFDAEFLYFNLVVVLANIPLVWFLYLWWQPRLINGTLESLRGQKVFADAEGNGLEAFTKDMTENLDSYRWSISAAMASLALVLVTTLVVYPEQSRQLVEPFFWFYDKYYYFLVLTPVRFLTYYVTAMVVLRGVLTLIWFNLLFQRLKITVHPLHPDQAGGLGALGRLGIQYGLIAVALGALLALVTVDRIVHGAGWQHIDLLVGYALYIVLAPVTLISPLWSAHQAMSDSRDKVLGEISTEFERILTAKERLDHEALSVSTEALDALRARYILVRDSYPTWPISVTAFRNFSVTASLPLITGAASIVIEMAIKK